MTNPIPLQSGAASAVAVTPASLRPPRRWHDPLKLVENEAPSDIARIVLWVVALLVLLLIVWASFGKLDIIATAEGKLVPQTLLKIVQPAEAGVVRELLVAEGDSVKAGQILARLDATLATADMSGIHSDLATQQMQVRRIEALLSDTAMLPKAGDDAALFGQVQREHAARRKAFLDALDQEKTLLVKAEHENQSAREILAKLEQTLPAYQEAADNYANLSREGYVPSLRSAEKQREALEKRKELDAQRSTVAAFGATIAAQQTKVRQLHSSYRSELEKELAAARARIEQLQPNLDKSIYREGQMALRAPQDGVIKDLATTTVGAVVQPGSVVLTLVPKDERLFADVNIKNEDVGFVQVGQRTKIKLAAYPFQRHGMLSGEVIRVSADATEQGKPGQGAADSGRAAGDDSNPASSVATYKARIALDGQALKDPHGRQLRITPGMQVVAEINQGQRTVLEYLLSPVKKTVAEAARER